MRIKSWFNGGLSTLNADISNAMGMFCISRAVDVLAVGEKLFEGELKYRQERYDEAFSALREAVWRDDHLFYTEPWAWMHPPRHALGALLGAKEGLSLKTPFP